MSSASVSKGGHRMRACKKMVDDQDGEREG